MQADAGTAPMMAVAAERAPEGSNPVAAGVVSDDDDDSEPGDGDGPEGGAASSDITAGRLAGSPSSEPNGDVNSDYDMC